MPATLDDSPAAHGRLPSTMAIHAVRGRRAILASYPWLSVFAASCAQPDAAEDLCYFLAKPGISARTPVLLCITARPVDRRRPIPATDLLGTLLVYEYSVAGLRSGLFTTNDRSGRTSLIAAPDLRSTLVSFAAAWLIERGAHLVMLSVAAGLDEDRSSGKPHLNTAIPSRWATRTRSIPHFLPLRSTFDETLAQIGQRTRSNMRYYRRRAEKDLGCVFHPEMSMTRRELTAFNRDCMYAVPNRVACWRLRTLHQLSEPVLMGLRDRDGRLISLIGGRRLGKSTEVLWQMNRSDLPQYSLSLVLRTYLLEHEIARGVERFYIEGGSSHPIRYSFLHRNIVDLAVTRHSLRASLVFWLSRRRINPENDLAAMLIDPSTQWNDTGAAVSAVSRDLTALRE